MHVWATLIGHSGLFFFKYRVGRGIVRGYEGSWRELEGVEGVDMEIRRHM